MAKHTDNNATFGMSGKINQFVFRQRFGKTIIAKPPVRTAPFTEAQKKVNSIFRKAVLFAGAILQDQAIRMAYSEKLKPGQTVHNLAVADYLKSPEILYVDLTALTAEAGSKISVLAIDNFRVEAVKVKVEKENGIFVEEGDAIIQNDGLTWEYITTTANANTIGNKITIIAIDLPGNKTLEQRTLWI